jgi:CDP-glucose 4,6-dehydratase
LAIGFGTLEALGVTQTTWQSETVLVTGNTGFKGAWLSLWLSDLGAKVVGYALPPPSQPNIFDALGLSVLTENIEADVRDLARLRSVMRDVRPTIVMHLAAQALVAAGYADPVETYASNLMGTVNVLEAVRSVESVKAVIVVTSDKCYRSDVDRAHTESDALGGNDPYSDSKACAELATACLRRAFFSDSGAVVATARAGNVIGGGDWAVDRIVPDAVRACYGSKTLRLRYPGAVRPWQHVFEPLHGYLMLADRARAGDRSVADAWNFGPSPTRKVPVRDLVDAIANRLGTELTIETEDRPLLLEASSLALDSAKAERELGWRAELSFDEVVNYTSDWYRAYYEGANMREISRAQLRAFAK